MPSSRARTERTRSRTIPTWRSRRGTSSSSSSWSRSARATRQGSRRARPSSSSRRRRRAARLAPRPRRRARPPAMPDPTPPKALLFDVFGTCVDWRAGVVREGEALAARQGFEGVDWGAVADAWRDRYEPQLDRVRSGARPWTTLDVLHREALDEVLAEMGID